jgi:hypothetical protein
VSGVAENDIIRYHGGRGRDGGVAYVTGGDVTGHNLPGAYRRLRELKNK